MTPNQEFVLKLLHEGLDYLKLVVPALIAWHMPQPKYMQKKETEEKDGKGQ